MIRRRKEGKVWSLHKADTRFSIEIRERDRQCQFPDCPVSDLKKLQCSHYFGRAIKSTRFDPDNCIALCWLHHYKNKLLGFEYQKQIKDKHGHDGQYTLFMRRRLGTRRFKALCERAAISTKQTLAISKYQVSCEHA